MGKFSLRILLIALTLLCVLVFAMSIPSRNARKIQQLIQNTELIGPHKYVPDATIGALNEFIADSDGHVPTYTHSFEVEPIRQSLVDLCLLRKKLVIEYTTHPIPPAYQGPIDRHEVSYDVGLFKARKTGHTKKLLWEYYE